MNEAAVRLLGFSEASEIIGRWSSEFIAQDEEKLYFKPASKDTPFRYELKFRQRDGSTIFVENQISIIEYEGRPSSLVFSRDISVRKNFEIKLDALHKHSIQIKNVENLDDITSSTIEVLEKILGYEYVGFGIVKDETLIYGDNSEKRSILKLPINGPGILMRAVHSKETQYAPDTRKDEDYISYVVIGENQLLSEMCVPVIVNGVVFGVINIESGKIDAFDENDKKLIETLAEHVSSGLTIYFEKEKLKQSLRKLEESNRELDEYTYAVSHDLRSPLRNIQAFSEMLRDEALEKLNENEKNYIQRIIGSVNRMRELIEELLVLSRINRKFTELEMIDLNEIIENSKVDLGSIIKEKGGLIISDELPKLLGHKVWLQQLFSNLISNGLKFNESEEPTVWIGYEDHYDYHRFNIRDNGIGIKEEYYEDIFKLFQRLHTTDEYPGTGAGLTICKKIVESYGGKIWIESKPTIGSNFYFSFPKKLDKINTIKQPIISPVDSPQIY